MATIVDRSTTSRSAFLAQITRRGHNFQESRTFKSLNEAKVWAAKREKEVDKAIRDGKTPTPRSTDQATLGHAIDKYISESPNEIGRTKTQVLNTIRKEYDISNKRCDQIKSRDIVAFAEELRRRPNLSSPSTWSAPSGGPV